MNNDSGKKDYKILQLDEGKMVVPLDIFIRGSEEQLLGASDKSTARKYGFDISPFDGTIPELIDGLKEVRDLPKTMPSDMPITEIKPMSPSDRGKKNSEGGGRQRKDGEN